MKTYNKQEDKKLNALAIDYVGGKYEALEEFMDIVFPKLKRFAGKFYTFEDTEDLAQEFQIIAIEMTHKFVESYNDGSHNIMGLIYTACKRRMIDLGRRDKALKRASKVTIGDDVISREVSIYASVAGDSDSTIEEFVQSEQDSIEEITEKKVNKKVLKQVVAEFVQCTKGRNAIIVPLIFEAHILEWETDYLNEQIADVLQTETGKEPTNEGIRQAKSRGLKAIRNAILDGKIPSANRLAWDF